MTVTIVEEARPVTGGVDTHADTHVAAALDPVGGLLGVEEFPATAAGYARLLGWLGGFGTVCLVGIEGTGSYGAGLARHITAAGVRVVEVDLVLAHGRPVPAARRTTPRRYPRAHRSARRHHDRSPARLTYADARNAAEADDRPGVVGGCGYVADMRRRAPGTTGQYQGDHGHRGLTGSQATSRSSQKLTLLVTCLVAVNATGVSKF